MEKQGQNDVNSDEICSASLASMAKQGENDVNSDQICSAVQGSPSMAKPSGNDVNSDQICSARLAKHGYSFNI